MIDLFCGAGGLTVGLETAGWSTVAAVDVDRDCMSTLQATRAVSVEVAEQPGRVHLAGAALLHSSVAELAGRDLRPAGADARWRPDLLAGGPPCQPFSSAGKQRGVEDPRGQLFVEFVRLTEELRPRFVLFENVRGLLTAKTPDGRSGGVLRLVQRSFEEIGYACRFAAVNAADYGAPQRRVRLFMLAARDRRLPQFPVATHSRNPEPGLDGTVPKPWPTLAEFLAEHPEPDSADVVRPTGARARDLIALTPGTGLRTGGTVEANRPGGHWGYRQDSFLADLTLPARTIRAASTPDWVRLGDGSMRRLTWREAAGLQGFPSAWQFQGTLASRFRQIGNAVQGHVARSLGETLLAELRSGAATRPVSPPWPAEFHRRIVYTQREHDVNGEHRAAARSRRQD